MRWVIGNFRSSSQRTGERWKRETHSHMRWARMTVPVCSPGKVWYDGTESNRRVNPKMSSKDLAWGPTSHCFKKRLISFCQDALAGSYGCFQTLWTIIQWAFSHLKVAWLLSEGKPGHYPIIMDPIKLSLQEKSAFLYWWILSCSLWFSWVFLCTITLWKFPWVYSCNVNRPKAVIELRYNSLTMF